MIMQIQGQKEIKYSEGIEYFKEKDMVTSSLIL